MSANKNLAEAIDAFAKSHTEQALQRAQAEIEKLARENLQLQRRLETLNTRASMKEPKLIILFDEAGQEVGRARIRTQEAQTTVDRIANELNTLAKTFDFEPAATTQRLVIGQQEVEIPPGVGMRPIGVKPTLEVNGVAEQYVVVWEAYRSIKGRGQSDYQYFEHSNPVKAVLGLLNLK